MGGGKGLETVKNNGTNVIFTKKNYFVPSFFKEKKKRKQIFWRVFFALFLSFYVIEIFFSCLLLNSLELPSNNNDNIVDSIIVTDLILLSSLFLLRWQQSTATRNFFLSLHFQFLSKSAAWILMRFPKKKIFFYRADFFNRKIFFFSFWDFFRHFEIWEQILSFLCDNIEHALDRKFD